MLQGVAAMSAAVAYGAWRRAHGAAAPGGGFAVAAITACVAVTLAPLDRAESAVFPAWSADGWQTCGAIWTAMLSGSILVLCITLRHTAPANQSSPLRAVTAMRRARWSASRYRRHGRVRRPHQ